ncbi:hypothetical protein, partial [Ruminococcus sp.]|uniref:hypothetical protein n=1 Tax=Ruminococcus sp. TaxID=41978 RepID=UPI0025906E9B
EMRDPYSNASSTQIMTRNILKGFGDNCNDITFVAIIKKDVSKENIKEYYNGLYTRLFFVNDITKNRRNRIKGLLSMLWHTAIIHSRKNIDDICKLIDDDTVLVSHSPSIDSILICRAIKQKFPKIRYIQYWSDPITLALISPKDYTVKRLPFYWVENRLHKSADTIVYGTKSLYIGQKSLFKKYCNKMAYCDVSYCIDNETTMSNYSKKISPMIYGYFGGYNSSVRDIRQLYNAFVDEESKLVICGNGDISLTKIPNIDVLNRVPQSEVASLEASADVYICILNKHGIQIPGKVFYLTDTDKFILVICDGDYKKEIREYLSSFKRFIFCENTADDIRRVIKEINMGQHSIDKSELYRLSPKYVSKSIIDGGFKE